MCLVRIYTDYAANSFLTNIMYIHIFLNGHFVMLGHVHNYDQFITFRTRILVCKQTNVIVTLI